MTEGQELCFHLAELGFSSNLLSLSLSLSQCGSVFGGQAPNVAHLHDSHVASSAL